MLSQFRWYRRWRGGYWARVTGWLWGTRWVQCGPKDNWQEVWFW